MFNRRYDKIRVGIDLDNVIWDLTTPWLERFNHITGDWLKPEDITTYDITEHMHKGNADILYYILEQSDFWDNVKPYDGVYETLRDFNRNFDVYIVTSTSYKIASRKLSRFLDLFPFMCYNQIITCHNKQMINVDWMIDDYEKNLVNGNFNKVLIDQPYNKDFLLDMWKLCEDKKWHFIRATNLRDAYDKINTIMV